MIIIWILLILALFIGFFYLTDIYTDRGYRKDQENKKNEISGKTTADYFTFNVDNSALILGESGSGKSYMAHSLIERHIQALWPNKVEFLVFDHKRVEFTNLKLEHDINPDDGKFEIVFDSEETLKRLGKIAASVEERARLESKKMLFIYMEECDAARLDQKRFDDAVIKINTHAKKANIKLLYSTSLVGRPAISKRLQESFDLILAGLQPQINYKQIGINNNKATERFDFQIINNKK